jgi:hypothetical protein
MLLKTSVAEPAPGKNINAAPALTLLYSKPTFLKQAKVYKRVSEVFSPAFF